MAMASSLQFQYSTLFTIFFCLLPFSPLTLIHGTFSEDLPEAISLKRMQKTTHLHFYFHDIVSGPHPTVVKVANAKDKDPQAGGFGATFIMDDALTEGPDPRSKLVGRAQGLYAMASERFPPALLMAVNYEFTAGKYNGSSVTVLGRNPVMSDVREMPVVGGSGLFRLARGYALAHTVWLDLKTGDATVEYNVYVMHF
ncbi:dirigent protein 22-like [Diospyros lotus]|uniref:dirigent protein 22-like n=1 Tax=Diospyros lotus TaxID=55363 RepID=UPI002259618D|nr:dirigent protein 22-like [Diospyros lotus]